MIRRFFVMQYTFLWIPTVMFLCSLCDVNALELNVDKSQKNMVKFISDAPIEDFEGVTNSIDGYIKWEGDELANEGSLYFEVDLRKVDTGIGLRNRHMRENYLHTDKYPFTNYKGKIIKSEKISDNEYKVTVDGKMFIHGVTKPLQVIGTLSPVKDGYRIKTNFQIKLTDYNIEVPQLMFMKISEVMRLNLDFYTKTIKK
jgi:polyisoprenoid-binding protein YceI